MVIDFQTDPHHAVHFDVMDLDTGLLPVHPETGRPLGIWYADDEAGIYRLYLDKNKSGSGPSVHFLGPDGEPVSSEIKGRIKIISREEGRRLRAMMTVPRETTT